MEILEKILEEVTQYTKDVYECDLDDIVEYQRRNKEDRTGNTGSRRNRPRIYVARLQSCPGRDHRFFFPVRHAQSGT